MLVEPAGVPMGKDITPESKNICDLAAEQGAKRAREQVVDQTETFKIIDEVWALNSDKAKLKAEMIGPYIVIAVNQDFKTCWVQDKTGKLKNLHMDSLCIVKAWVHQQSSKFDIPKEFLDRYGARSIDNITK